MKETDPKRFSFLITDEEKLFWKQFIKENKISSISQLIRESIDFYTQSFSTIKFFNDFSKYLHEFKEPLTNIKVISELLLENKDNDINLKNLLLIKEISDQAELLNQRISNRYALNQNDIKEVDNQE